jgi:hypothetical protein
MKKFFPGYGGIQFFLKGLNYLFESSPGHGNPVNFRMESFLFSTRHQGKGGLPA